jgi:hypothetical protein
MLLVQHEAASAITEQSDIRDASRSRPHCELTPIGNPTLTTLLPARRQLEAIRVDVRVEEPLDSLLQISRRDQEIDTPLPWTLRRAGKRGSHRAYHDAQLADCGGCSQTVATDRPGVTQQRLEPLGRSEVELLTSQLHELGLSRDELHLQPHARRSGDAIERLKARMLGAGLPARERLAGDPGPTGKLILSEAPPPQRSNNLS